MSNGLDPRQLPPSFTQALEQFARDNGMTVKCPTNPEEEAKGDFLCQLGFANADGQLCFLYLGRSPDGWSVWVQRWGLHSLIAGKGWDLPHGADAAALSAALERAWDFANEPGENPG